MLTKNVEKSSYFFDHYAQFLTEIQPASFIDVGRLIEKVNAVKVFDFSTLLQKYVKVWKIDGEDLQKIFIKHIYFSKFLHPF